VDCDGQDVGRVSALFVDSAERKVRFLQVASGGVLGVGERRVLLPVDAVTRVVVDHVCVDHTRERVAEAPVYDPNLTDRPDPAFLETACGSYGHAPY